MKSFTIFLLLFLSGITTAYCDERSPEHFPQALMYHGKPIDPLCFYESEEKKYSILLSKCGINALPHRKITSPNEVMIKKGFIGYDYIWSADGNLDMPANAASYYKVIGQVDNAYVIFANNSTGGSGYFSDIYLVKRDQETIQVQFLAGGDRCNGGIDEVRLENKKIIYTANITPGDFLDLSEQNPHHLAPYDDLASCAVCCIATAKFMIAPPYKGVKSHLMSVDLGKEISTDAFHQGIYQDCFDELVKTQQKTGKHVLDNQALKTFVTDFNKQCVKATKPTQS